MWLDPPPPDLIEGGAYDSNVNTFVFAEQGPVQLTSPIAVNRTTAGTFGGTSNPGGTIPAGTWVCSYFIVGDRLDDSGILTGALSFGSSSILGLIYRRDLLLASASLANPGVTYDYRPMESNDQMIFDGGGSLSWSMTFGGGLDEIRIITTCP